MIPAINVILSFLNLDSILFSSYLFNTSDKLEISMFSNFVVPFSFWPLVLVIFYFLIAVILKLRKTAGFQRRLLDIIGVIFFFLVYSIFYNESKYQRFRVSLCFIDISLLHFSDFYNKN